MAWKPVFRRSGVRAGTMSNRFGSIGTIQRVVGHYTAGPRDRSWTHARDLFRTYSDQHRRQGWGGIGYHYGIGSNGDLFLLRRVAWKGAHTAGRNTGSVGIVVHGTVGQRATQAQQRTLRWLLANAHTNQMPASHRAPRSLAKLPVFGHNDFMATQCPGLYKPFFTSRGSKR